MATIRAADLFCGAGGAFTGPKSDRSPLRRDDREPPVSNVDRIPPNSLEAEMALLGAMVVGPQFIETAREIVSPGDFYASLHETIFGAITALHDARKPVDKVSLAEELRRRGMLDKIGGMAYLSSLMEAVPTAASAEYYARIVREKAALRALIHAGMQITRLGYEGEDDAEKALAQAESAMTALTLRTTQAVRLEDPSDAIDRIVAEMQTGKRPQVTYSPWPQINRLCGGFGAGELIAVPAAPGLGKSGFAQTWAEYVADRQGPVLMCSIEMGAEATHRRRLAQFSNVAARAQKHDSLSSQERQRVYAAANLLRERRLYVTGKPHRSLRMIWRAAREAVQKSGPLRLIAVDHVGWVEEVSSGGRNDTKNERKSQVYMNLILLAEEFGCPVLAVDHVNRDGMQGRPNYQTIGKIRDGGNVEGHAHHIIFLWREDPINQPRSAEAIIAKSRDGANAMIPMDFDGPRSLWVEQGQEAWFEYAPAVEARTFQDAEDDLGDPPF